MKTSFQKRCLRIALLVWLVPLGIWLMGCSVSHRLNCTDMASHAGHSAQMRIGGDVWVAIDHVHAQAYIDRKDGECWLTIDNGLLIERSRCELQSIEARYPLETWDYLMKEILSSRFITKIGN